MAIDITLLWIILDVGTFFIIPLLFLKDWKLALLFFLGFLSTQVSIPNNPWIEYLYEVIGIIIILIACKKVKNEKFS